MSAITIPCTFDSATRRKDRSVRLAFTSNLEISPEDLMEMDRRLSHSGWMLFAENELQAKDIPDVPADEAFGKMSLSQEMRWEIKQLYLEKPGDIDWPDYYRSVMTKIIEQLRARRQ